MYIILFLFVPTALCPKNVRCNGGGFVDQNCQCVCKDGTQNCQEGAGQVDTVDSKFVTQS